MLTFKNGKKIIEKMKFEKGEFTTSTFLEYMKKEYGTKLTGEDFNASDIAQYLMRGYTPHRYGNHKITSKLQNGIRIITIEDFGKKK